VLSFQGLRHQFQGPRLGNTSKNFCLVSDEIELLRAR